MNQKLIRIDDEYIEAIKLQIRDARSDAAFLGLSLHRLGSALGKHLISRFFLRESEVTTPMNHAVKGLVPDIPKCVIISKREDRCHFSTGIQDVLDNSEKGFIDFAGRRGPSVSEHAPRAVELPKIDNVRVGAVVIAKAAIAGGCSVAEMARRAAEKYIPPHVIFVAGFYTQVGLAEIQAQFPSGDLLVAGEADALNEDRMLIPGIGQLDARLNPSSTCK